MQITLQIPTEKLMEAVSEGIARAFADGKHEPHEIISKAISDGVKEAISDSLGKHWGEGLCTEIATHVAAAMKVPMT